MAETGATGFRRFVLVRYEDESGVSGTGVVAEGVQFSTGRCVLAWVTRFRSLAMYNHIDEIRQIHGHDGKTHVSWLDEDDRSGTPGQPSEG